MFLVTDYFVIDFCAFRFHFRINVKQVRHIVKL